MQEIEIGKSCYGSYVYVDGIDPSYILDENYPDIKRGLQSQEKRNEILKYLSDINQRLDSDDWKQIMEIIISRSQCFESEEETDLGSCETCGDYNWQQKYKKVIEE